MARLDAARRRQLVEVLANIPATDSHEGRSLLLAGLPRMLRFTTDRFPSAWNDLTSIITTADEWERGALEVVIENALPLVQGTEHEGRLRAFLPWLATRQRGRPNPWFGLQMGKVLLGAVIVSVLAVGVLGVGLNLLFQTGAVETLCMPDFSAGNEPGDDLGQALGRAFAQAIATVIVLLICVTIIMLLAFLPVTFILAAIASRFLVRERRILHTLAITLFSVIFTVVALWLFNLISNNPG
jgi:hypothetical protein